jgi:hypothetical protein
MERSPDRWSGFRIGIPIIPEGRTGFGSSRHHSRSPERTVKTLDQSLPDEISGGVGPKPGQSTTPLAHKPLRVNVFEVFDPFFGLVAIKTFESGSRSRSDPPSGTSLNMYLKGLSKETGH